MDERENVMTALEICSSECSDDCPMKDREWKETGNAACRAFMEEDIVELPERLIRRTIALLKAQEPRLVTAEDFRRADAGNSGEIPCWKEPKSPTRREGWAVIVYGKWLADAATARYWTGKPSEQQKRAVKWE